MIESRCGLKCSECSYRESMNCKGCSKSYNRFGHRHALFNLAATVKSMNIAVNVTNSHVIY